MKNYLLIPICFALAFSCKKDPPVLPPPPQQATIAFKAEDASCTEAWLTASTTEVPATVRLVLLGPTPQTKQTLRLISFDSLLVDEGLLPNRTYTYQLQKLDSDSSVIETSAAVQLTTMDTTSHNFTWQVDTLGDGGSSVLYDVAIINDTLVYAVGEIWKRDSSGNWVNPPFNIARWNGQRWELMRRLFDCRLYYPNCGPEFFLFTPIRAIFAFGPDDIWVAAGTAQHFDGANWTEHAGVQGVGSASKIWGSNSDDLWFVGNNGFIVHKSGTTWRQLESGTTVSLNDVWGGNNRWMGENQILVAASNKYEGGEKKLLRINQHGVLDSLAWPMQTRRIHSVWFNLNSRVYTSGGGVFAIQRGNSWTEQQLPLIYTNSIRGTAANDIFVVGDFRFAGHFNGVRWHVYPEIWLGSGLYHSVAAKGNMIVAVGWLGSRGMALVGRR